MQNKGTDYIRKILKDKVRLRRWRKVMLCLSCIVVFCTVYVLILPAITLERKTTCGQEEHIHAEECYSGDGQLICGRAEHLHTETCYAAADSIPDIQSEAAEWEENPIQEENGNTVQNESGNTAQDEGGNAVQNEDGNVVQNEGGNTIQAEGNAGETEFMPDEPSDQDSGTIEGGEDAAEDMAAGFTSGDESSAEDLAEPTATPAPNSADGFDLSAVENREYLDLDKVKLLYQLPDGVNWQEISLGNNETVIPANAKIKLQVGYKDIPIAALKDSYNCKLTYALPELLRNITAEGAIYDNNQKQVGTVTSANGKMIVTFEQAYLESLTNNQSTTITGDFYVLGDVKLSQLPSDTGKTTVETADKTYYLNFGPDAVAKYGQISVVKECTSNQVISTPDGDYLAYTITVTAGEDGCPDVSVVDTIVSNLNCVDSYVGIGTSERTLSDSPNKQDPYETIAEDKTHGRVYLGNTTAEGTIPPVPQENASITAPGSMVWKIGDMTAGESRTLTYYVKLKDNVNLNKKEIKNKADVYSKSYKRAYDEKSFTPKINYGMKKSHENIVRNSDGTYTITYKIEFNLDRNNSNYALKNLELRDYLDASDIRADPKALPYISYNCDSVKLYVKKDENSDFVPVPATDYTVSWANGDDNYVAPWNDSDKNPTRFKITGVEGKPIAVNPGDAYYATYTVTVKPEALAAMKANNVDVKNRYYVYASNAVNTNSNFGGALDRVFDSSKVGNYKWDEKIVGTGTEADQTIEMGAGAKYDLTSETVQPDSSTDSFFIVPAGSYPYIVDVNQTLGEWNVTNVSMKDELTPNDKVKYIGYAKVEACEYNATTKTYDVKETKWVKIAGLTKFELTPSNLGWNNVNYAYRFTYYAMPANANFSSAKVKNKFSLSGSAVKGNGSFDISNIYSQKEITVSGSFKMNVKKDAWYYEEPKTGATTWQNGKLYWVIEVSGTAILQGTYFRDAISKDSGLTDSYLHTDSLAGIYMGTLPDGKAITGYGSLEELQNTGKLSNVTNKFTSELTNSKNFTGTGNYSELSLQAEEQITLGEAKLYFVVRSEPQSLPTKYRDAFTYRNHISTSDNGSTWIDHGSAEKLLCGGADILKELGQTFTYDGTTVTSKADGADKGGSSKIVNTALPGAGQYAAWAFKVNYAGELSGTYRVLETIPDGMELAYIRIKWVGGGQNFAAMSSKEIPAFKSEGWEEKRITAGTDNGAQKETIYYVKDKQALIELGDFTAGKDRDSYSVDVQVVCKVTDPDVLLGGEEKTFTNQVTLQTKDGREINTATSPATIEPQKKLDKKITSNGTEKITFTIEANSSGETLPAENGTTLTLIDKLSSTLILDTGSIKVTNSKTNEDVDYTASFDVTANTLKIAIPCNVPVKITYDATVDAPPGQTVSFSNDAYWEKYSPAGGDSVKEENYSYTAGGTVQAGDNITLKIIKKDQNNLSSLLQGAKFEIIQCRREENGIITDVLDKKWDGTTNENGEISFGSGSSTDDAMNYNTIYKVTETVAPSGYAGNSEPIYIMVPRKEKNTNDYSDYVKTCINDSRIHKQYKSTYELTVLNHKGEITVEKKFRDPGGHDASPVSGTYRFGLYENADGTNTQNPGGITSGTTTEPLQTITITYRAGETNTRTEKFVNLDLSKKYYVFELDDDGNPIKDSATAATVNKMEYFTSYEKPGTAGTATEGNCAVNGETVRVINQSRVKELPSTGGYGSLIYRLAGTILILFAGLLMLINIKKQTCRNR